MVLAPLFPSMAMFHNHNVMENRPMEFENINPQTWKPMKESDSVEGIYTDKRESVGANHSNCYYLEKDGQQVMIWGSTIIDDRMKFVKIGDYVKITYKGTTLNKNKQKLNIFDVQRAKVKTSGIVTEEHIG
jgi:hypothetical protein